jgi:hypothetical protein
MRKEVVLEFLVYEIFEVKRTGNTRSCKTTFTKRRRNKK